MKMTARKLAAHNPDQRPSLLQVAALPSEVANVVVERKAWRSLLELIEMLFTLVVSTPTCICTHVRNYMYMASGARLLGYNDETLPVLCQ